jgi:hypothetical protein
MRRTTVSFEKPLFSNRLLITFTRLEGISLTVLMGVGLALMSGTSDDAELEPEEI